MTREFPTIKQMTDAILFAMCDNYGKCEYHQDTHTFIAVEMIPIPCRDSGGSIDSIDFEPVEHSISFQEGYHYWVAMMDFIEDKVTPIPAPVAPWIPNIEDDDLPFLAGIILLIKSIHRMKKYYVRLLAALPMLGTGISMIVFGVMAFDNALWILLCITNFWSFMILASNYEAIVFNMAYFLKRMANDAMHE